MPKTKGLLSFIYFSFFIFFFAITILSIHAAWNLQYSAGYLLLPAADDWMDVKFLASYINNENVWRFLHQRDDGHPQLLIKLVALLYYKLGYYSYKEAIQQAVIIHLIPWFLYSYIIINYTNYKLNLKLALICFPGLFFFHSSWWGILRIIQGHIWSYGYVFTYLTLFLTIIAKNRHYKTFFYGLATFCAIITCLFFPAAFMIWGALYYLLVTQEEIRWYRWLVLFAFSCTIILFLTMPEIEHTPRSFYSEIKSKFFYFLHHPQSATNYIFALFGDAIFTPQLQAKIYYGIFVLLISLILLIKNIKTPSPQIGTRFLTAVLLVSLFVILIIGINRFNNQHSPTNYLFCALALHVPLIALLFITIHHYFENMAFIFLISFISMWLSYASYIFHNPQASFGLYNGLLYERESLAIALGADIESVRQQFNYIAHPQLAIVSNAGLGYAKWPALAFLHLPLNKIAQIQKPSISIKNNFLEITEMNLFKPKMLQLRGNMTAINNIDPQYLIITDKKEIVITVASLERNRIFNWGDSQLNWLTYLAYDKTQGIHLWVFTKSHQAYPIGHYSMQKLLATIQSPRLHPVQIESSKHQSPTI